MRKIYFVSGIGTEIGKSIVSAVLVEKLKADYWKPIQSGDLENSDTMKVQDLISNKRSIFHTESYRLNQPFSPHYSAQLDGVSIDLNNIDLPKTANNLIIEGAGGLLVPLNDTDSIIDLIKKLEADVILVSKNYLGSINHTLLSIEALEKRKIKIKALIFNGEENKSSENIIQKMSQIPLVGRINAMVVINKFNIKDASEKLILDL